jgi:hypothetical protein
VWSCSQESSELKEASDTLHADRRRLEEERDELVSKQQNGESLLRQQCKEVRFVICTCIVRGFHGVIECVVSVY